MRLVADNDRQSDCQKVARIYEILTNQGESMGPGRAGQVQETVIMVDGDISYGTVLVTGFPPVIFFARRESILLSSGNLLSMIAVERFEKKAKCDIDSG